MKDRSVFQLKQRKNRDQNGQYSGGFQTQAKVRWERNQIPNPKFQKIIKYEIKKRCQNTRRKSEREGFYPLIFNLFEICFLIFDF
jgi:hypothetical protein